MKSSKILFFFIIILPEISVIWADRSPYAPFAAQLVLQIIPPGKPWPSTHEGYSEFSQTTSRPLTILAPYIAEKATEKAPWLEFNPNGDEWVGSVQELPLE